MADGFTVDPATFTSGAGALRRARRFTGGMAGADQVGQQFSAQYYPAAASLVSLIGKLGDGLEPPRPAPSPPGTAGTLTPPG